MATCMGDDALPSRNVMPTGNENGITSEILDQIAARLRPACPDIPESEFQLLVIDVARAKVKTQSDTFAHPATRDTARASRAV